MVSRLAWVSLRRLIFLDLIRVERPGALLHRSTLEGAHRAAFNQIVMSSSSSWQSEMDILVSKMLYRKDSYLFREPVDWKSLGLVDYPEIIKKPADLGTIKRRLQSGALSSPEAVIEHVRRVWTNAMLYNQPISEIYALAKQLSIYWEGLLAASPCARYDPSPPPSREQLVELGADLHKLSSDDVTRVLLALRESCPDCLYMHADSNEVHVNLDLLSGEACLKARQFVDERI